MKIPFCILFLFCFLFFSCQDNCDFYRTYTAYDPIYSKIEDIRDSVSFEPKRDINNPGKLNYKGGYLFITETGKGIHIIDNRNINNPINIGFIVLPGNYDIATKGDYLYADSYIDLVVFDISNINSIIEINRIEGTFENYYIDQGLYSEELGIIVGFEEEVIEEYIENYDCELAID